MKHDHINDRVARVARYSAGRPMDANPTLDRAQERQEGGGWMEYLHPLIEPDPERNETYGRDDPITDDVMAHSPAKWPAYTMGEADFLRRARARRFPPR